ncbi:PLDc N-terminal domain-containing protein [Maribacter hydrothermalis]|uniref:Cardiolipin synthase N-terminal domain-containing protein n=1 Tax=Maribacter hydrothermalis TaxID=1836467 RepID=A0A1B7Z284_9FLAO|nr:hypothetical protein BTR34_13695 [Maribacter hydrothermalis]OBR36660.1 hypothetical protein A9200_09590 [Maribacter hydrothermalis]
MEHTASDFSLGLGIWQTFLLVIVVLWAYCIIDILRHTFRNDAKITWFLIVFLFPLLGSLLYLYRGKDRRVLPD